MKICNIIILFGVLLAVNCGPNKNIEGGYERRIVTACSNGIEKLNLDNSRIATVETYLTQSNLAGYILYRVEYGKWHVSRNGIKIILDSTRVLPYESDVNSSCHDPKIQHRDSISLLYIPYENKTSSIAIKYFDNYNNNYRWAEYTKQLQK